MMIVLIKKKKKKKKKRKIEMMIRMVCFIGVLDVMSW